MKYFVILIAFIFTTSCAVQTGTLTFTITGPAESIVESMYTSNHVMHGIVQTPYTYSQPIYNGVFGDLWIWASDRALITVFVNGLYYGESIGKFEH